MLLRKIILLFSVIFITSTFAQRKKTDTIYVYEKVIVYDTVYLEKAIKLKPANLKFSSLEIEEEEIKEINLNIDKEELEEQIKKLRTKRFQYGIQAGIGFKKASWAKFSSEKTSISGKILEYGFLKALSIRIFH